MAAIPSFLNFSPFLVAILLVILKCFNFKKPTPNLCLPPSPPALPLIGHLHHLSLAAYGSFHKISSKYGPLLYLRLGSYHLVLVSSASMATEVFKTQDLNFSAKPQSVFDDNILFGNLSFFLAPYGDYWRFMKKLCVSELLGARQLERSRDLRREELMRFLRKVLDKAQGIEVVDLTDEIMSLTNNTVCRLAMSARCSGGENEAEKCRELMNESFDLASKMTVINLLGPLKKLGFLALKKKSSSVFRRYDHLLEKLLQEHEEKAKKEGSGGIERADQRSKDLMDIVLEVYHDKEADTKISRDQMKAFFVDIFIGGTDTSSQATLWAMAELINNPNVFRKVREEIESVVGRNRLVEESDIANLPYLRAVVRETLRLHPPVPVIPRACRESCKIRGFDIPKGTVVVINSYSIMRELNVWENPNRFYPERFLASSQEIINGKTHNFIPFGGGRRMCPGANLAFGLVTFSVAAMVQCFDWKIAGDGEGAKANMQIKPGMTTSMAYPLLCSPVVHFNPFAA